MRPSGRTPITGGPGRAPTQGRAAAHGEAIAGAGSGWRAATGRLMRGERRPWRGVTVEGPTTMCRDRGGVRPRTTCKGRRTGTGEGEGRGEAARGRGCGDRGRCATRRGKARPWARTGEAGRA